MTYWKPPRDPAREAAAMRNRIADAQRVAKKAQEEETKRQRREQAFARNQAMNDQNSQHFENVTAYTQVVLLLGYGGYFTLWVQSRPLMSLWMFGTTGALLTFSLLTFIGWEVWKAWASSELAAKLDDGKISIHEHNRRVKKTNEHHRKVFIVGTASGLLGGISLLLWYVYSAIVAAAAWPAVVNGTTGT